MPDIDDANRELIAAWLGSDDLVAEGVRHWLVASRRLAPDQPVDDARISHGDVTWGEVLRSTVESLEGLRKPSPWSAAALLDDVARVERGLLEASSLDYAAAKENRLDEAIEAQRRMLALHGEGALIWERLAGRATDVWHVVAALHRAASHRNEALGAERALYDLERWDA